MSSNQVIWERAAKIAEGLYPHQVEGVAFLMGRRRSILADDMGLGKTRQSVIAMSQAQPVGPYLVICPATVKRNWVSEIAIVSLEYETKIIGPGEAPDTSFKGWVIINYDILGKHLDVLSALDWKGVVFDEAHYLKNHRSQRHKYSVQLVGQLSEEATIHMLTGTPLTSRPRDLFPLLLLAGHALGRSFMSFAKRYCDAYKGEYGWVADGASNIEELTVHLHGIMLRRTKNEVLDLPPKIRTWLDVEVSSRVAHRMGAAVLNLLDRYSRISVSETLAEPPSAQERGRALGQLTSARRRLATSKIRTTLPFVQDVIEQGEKAIVFSCFLRPLQILKQKFGHQAVTITGEVSVEQRQENANLFQNDGKVRLLLANITVGGVGLNLTTARQVIFNDLDWVPANHWQAEDRAYRIGQTSTVNVTYMVGRNTVDEFIRTVLETKAELIDQMVGGKALPQDFQRDVLGEMRRVMRVLQPSIVALLAQPEDTEMDSLLRQASQAFRQTHAKTFGSDHQVEHKLPSAEAIRTLVRVLSGPKVEHFRVESSSKPGSFYDMEVDGNDVTCSCRGFQFRGNCQHARALKVVLVKDQDLPDGYDRSNGGTV